MECNGTFTDTSREYVISDSSFLIDYKNLKIGDIIKKYVGRYENIEETPMDNPNEDEAYILYPKDYICIRRRWFPFEVLDEKSNVRKKVTKIRRIKDGEGRRHKLFINGVIRRLITNDTISFDNLLFNLLHEFHCYYEHKDIGKNDIMQVAHNVWKADLKRYEGLRGAEHQFRVNPLYCTKYGVSKKQAKQKAAKQLKNQEIGELYDFSLTDKENVEEFKKYGVNISIRTLKRWRMENGMTKYKKPNNTVVATEVIDMDSFLDSP